MSSLIVNAINVRILTNLQQLNLFERNIFGAEISEWNLLKIASWIFVKLILNETWNGWIKIMVWNIKILYNKSHVLKSHGWKRQR